jgi:lycopene cyclase domain-containing protein|tara:strand:+ start:1760 stop:2089 length:330 start_codon:yes stop_codon:yes gene_type:complete
MITYSLLAGIAVIVVFVLGIAVMKSGLISRPQFWISWAIISFFQLLTNGYLTSQKIVTYNSEAITGTRIAYAPIEDLFFGFALVTLTMLIWEWVGPTAKSPKRRSAARS